MSNKLYLGSTLISAPAWWARPVTDWSTPVTVTANTASHTKGAWVEVIASTGTAVDRLDISVYGIGVSATNTASLLDVAVGGAGSETPVVSNVAVGGAVQASAGDTGMCFSIPVYIPSGSRVSVRIQSVVTGGKTCTVSIATASGSAPSGTSSSVPALGTSTATSAGTSLSGTAATYVEVVTATAANYAAICAVPSLSSTTVAAATRRRVQIAVGAAGAEVAIGYVEFINTTTELAFSPSSGIDKIIPVAVPAGSRLSATFIGAATTGMAITLLGVQALGV